MNFDKYKNYTQARIGLGRSGASIPTKAWLEFSYHHAAAVDAIHVPWDLPTGLGKTQVLLTQVKDRAEYLLRPDKGRCLDSDSKKLLEKLPKMKTESLLIAVSNGLSSFAVANHLDVFLKGLMKELEKEKIPLCAGKIFLIPDARVALIDDIGSILKPTLGLMIIGERPGLTSADSLACYLTYGPKNGLTDADRNCISNIRPPHGLSYEEAIFKAIFLIKESIRRKLSGVNLKDESQFLLNQ